MRKQIAAANWKMNLSWPEAEKLVDELLASNLQLDDSKQVILAVPFPYLTMVQKMVEKNNDIHVCAQNCYYQKSGAYTGEVSVTMLKSINVNYCLVGHSERRQYFNESNEILAKKVDLCLEEGITPIFCCGEMLNIRESNQQDEFVIGELRSSLFHLDAQQIVKVIVAYEPVWAIGTGKTATDDQAQEMHQVLRKALANKYGEAVANDISILYGGSVKASNAVNLLSQADVDGGLVGGASLISAEFSAIVQALNAE